MVPPPTPRRASRRLQRTVPLLAATAERSRLFMGVTEVDAGYQPRLNGTPDPWAKAAAGGTPQAVEPLTVGISVPAQLVKPDGDPDAAARAKPTARDSSGSLDSATLQINADSRTGSGAADSPRGDSDAEGSSPTDSAQTGASASTGTAATARAGEAGAKAGTARVVAKNKAETKPDDGSPGRAKPAAASGAGGGGGLLSLLLCCAGGGGGSSR